MKILLMMAVIGLTVMFSVSTITYQLAHYFVEGGSKSISNKLSVYCSGQSAPTCNGECVWSSENQHCTAKDPFTAERGANIDEHISMDGSLVNQFSRDATTASKDCEQLLDTVELSFDRRRQARYQHIHDQYIAMNGYQRNDDIQRKFDMFEPEAICFAEERFGSVERYKAFDDGPKFVCGVDYLAAKSKSSSGCLVYSVGSNNDVAFEAAVHEFIGCETHTFDPTLTSPFIGGEYAVFHDWGLGVNGTEMSLNGKNWTSKSIEHIIYELGHENRTIDILKIDCEGCEYDALPPLFDLMASGKVNVDQVQIEVHLLEKAQSQIDALFFAADKANLRIFHKERNHWGCSGYFCVEYALVSKSSLRDVNRATVCQK